jgi:FKBP-type peptidyl-prolyl cis-trans isomerase FkpA
MSFVRDVMRRVFPRLAMFVALVAVAGCGSPSAPSQANIPYSATDLRVGTGTEATTGRNVTVNYTGWLYDESRPDKKGAQFDTSIGRGPFPFLIGARAVIAGWDQGVPGMRVGGLRRLVLPPSLAYGSTGSGPIPPNAALVFDIELLTVQ